MLPENKIYTSDEACAAVQGGGTPAAARKKLSRAVSSGKLWRSEAITLEHNRRLFCNLDFVKTTSFPSQVRKVLKKERKSLERAALALEDQKILTIFELAKILAAPMKAKEKAKYPDAGKEFQALLEGKCAELEAPGDRLERVKFPKIKTDQAEAIAIERCGELDVARQMTSVVMQQLRNQNLISWNAPPTVQRDRHGVIFNNFAFSDASFTRLRPTNFRPTIGKEREAVPMVMDCFSRQIRLYDVESFVTRLGRAGEMNKKQQTFYGVMAGPSFANDAWISAKKEGLHLINLGQMFGDDALKLMKQYSDLAQSVTGNTDHVKSENLEKITESLTDLKSSPIVKDLRSIGLEILTSLLLKNEGFEAVMMNVDVPYKGVTRDVDATGKKFLDGRVIHRVVECKAHSKGVNLTEEEVKKFFCETVPGARQWLGGEDDFIMEAEIWTTGKISDEAQAFFDRVKPGKKMRPKIRFLKDLKSLVPRELKPARKLLEAIANPL